MMIHPSRFYLYRNPLPTDPFIAESAATTSITTSKSASLLQTVTNTKIKEKKCSERYVYVYIFLGSNLYLIFHHMHLDIHSYVVVIGNSLYVPNSIMFYGITNCS